MLILDIFAQRAKSRDGKLQVELAQLRYRLPRLHEKNTMMSRLTGGIGGRGPGETKLEVNRRRARERIHRLEKEIDRFGEQRAGAARRARAPRAADRRDRRLHQRRQVDAAQHAHRAATCSPRTSCSRRSIRRRAGCGCRASARSSSPTPSGFIRDLPQRSGARVPRHARGAGRGRPAAARRRRRRPGARAADRRRRGDPGGPGPGRDAPDPGDEQDRPAARGSERARVGARRRRSARWSPSPRRTAPRPRRCWRRSRRRWPARASRTPRRRPTTTAREPAVMSLRMSLLSVDRRGRGAAGRAHPGARAGALRVREAVRRQGAALLARLRARASFGFTCGETEYRLSLIPLGGYVRLLGEDPGEPIPPIDRPRALAAKPLWQRYTVVVAGPGVQPAPAAVHLLHPLRRPAHAAAADHRHRAARPARGARRACCPATGRERRRSPRPLLGGAGGHHLEVGRQDAAVRDPARPRRRGARRHAHRDRAVGPAAAQGARGLDRRVAALPPARDRRARSVVAGRAGRPARRSTSSPRSTAFRSATWTEFAKAIERAGASPLRLNYVRGGYSAVPFAHIEIEEPGLGGGHPGGGVRRRRRAATTRPASCRPSCSCSPSSPGSPADQIGLRRGDQILSLDGAPLRALGRAARAAGRAIPTRTSASAGSRRRACSHEATLPPGGPVAAGRQPPGGTAAWCSARSTGWPGRPTRRCRSRTGSATRSATRSSTPAQIIATMVYGFGEIVRGRVPLTDAGRPDHDRLRGRRRRRAGRSISTCG